LADALVRNVDETLRETRKIAKGLHPVVATPDGLRHALDGLGDRTRAMGIRFDLQCPDSFSMDDNQRAEGLYRIAEEAVTNAMKHAKPDFVAVSIKQTAQSVVLEIKDKGGRKTMSRVPRKDAGIGEKI